MCVLYVCVLYVCIKIPEDEEGSDSCNLGRFLHVGTMCSVPLLKRGTLHSHKYAHTHTPTHSHKSAIVFNTASPEHSLTSTHPHPSLYSPSSLPLLTLIPPSPHPHPTITPHSSLPLLSLLPPLTPSPPHPLPPTPTTPPHSHSH